MISIIFSMAVFAFIGAATPGPVNIIATSSSVNVGFVRTLPYVLGASIAYAMIVFLVGQGLNRVLLFHPQITDLLKYLGAAFLLYMSYQLAVTNNRTATQIDKRAAPSILQGGLAQGLNPKAWLVSMSGVSLFVTPNDPADFYLLVFTLLSFIICLLGVGIWAYAGSVLRTLLAQPRFQVTFNRLMGLLLSLTVVTMLL